MLKEELEKQGLVISEYPPGTPPNHYHFPARNRIISGLSQGTVVVEAGLGSGSLITAKEAILQGRDVFAIPANVGSVGAEGTNGLLRDGANMALCTEDILFHYRYVYADAIRPDLLADAKQHSAPDRQYLARLGVIELTPRRAEQVETAEENPPKKTAKKRRAGRKSSEVEAAEQIEAAAAEPAAVGTEQKSPDAVLSSLPPIQRAILEAIPDDRAITADSLCNLGYSYGDMIAALTMLEILGLVEKLPGALYTKS